MLIYKTASMDFSRMRGYDFVGNYYEVTGGVVTKYYYAGSQRVAMRANGTLYFLLGDHLGSTSLTTNDSGNVISELRYTPWGEVRYNAGVTPTDYSYTGQYDNTADFGLMFYNARWYDPYLNHFTQPDSIIPPGVQGLDRYAYGLNNPSRYTDPSGHVVCEVGEPCGPGATYVPETSMEDAISYMKGKIKDDFGVTLSNDGGKSWDARNVWLAYSRLSHINDLFKGKLKSIIDKAGGAIFDLKEYTGEGCPKGKTCSYGGWTDGTHITFSTTGGQAINTMNFYHEFGHMIDSLPGKNNIFSSQLDGYENPGFISNNYVNRDALLENFAEPIQASSSAVTEQWGDVFANYAAGNIDMSDPNGPGAEMYGFILPALDVFLADY